MVILELIASISVAFAFISAIVFAIIHMKNKQIFLKSIIHKRPLVT